MARVGASMDFELGVSFCNTKSSLRCEFSLIRPETKQYPRRRCTVCCDGELRAPVCHGSLTSNTGNNFLAKQQELVDCAAYISICSLKFQRGILCERLISLVMQLVGNERPRLQIHSQSAVLAVHSAGCIQQQEEGGANAIMPRRIWRY